MSYSISACPRCGRLKIFQPHAKTTGCPWCGKRYKPAQSREFASLDDARAALAVLSGSDAPRQEPMPRKRPRPEVAASVAESLTKELGSFTEAQFAMRAGEEGIENWQESLKKLAECGHIYETKAGRYKAV